MSQGPQPTQVELYRVVHKKGTVLLSTSLAWPAVACCSRAETFSQLSPFSFAQPCTCQRPKIEFEDLVDRQMQTVAVELTELVSFFGEKKVKKKESWTDGQTEEARRAGEIGPINHTEGGAFWQRPQRPSDLKDLNQTYG